jgi:hypothetical protein
MSSPESVLSQYSKGTKCWFPDKDEGWISGELVEKNVSGDKVSLKFVGQNGQVSSYRSLAHIIRFRWEETVSRETYLKSTKHQVTSHPKILTFSIA